MRPLLSKLCLLILGFAGLSRADYTFPIPTGTYLDSAAISTRFPARAFDEGKGTSTALSLSNQTLHLDVSWADVPQWGARAGVEIGFNNQGLCPATSKAWHSVDFDGVTAVSFFYKTSDAKTTVQFAPTSALYPGSASKDGVMMVAALRASAAGRSTTVALPNGITYLKWMTDQHAEETRLTWEEVKGAISTLRFQPMPVYDGTGDAVTVPTARLEISNVVIKATFMAGAASDYLCAVGTKCTGKFRNLSDFAGLTPRINAAGGRWFGFVDTSSALPSAMRGVSRLVDRSGDGTGLDLLAADAQGPARLSVTAVLDKGDSVHPYAGWGGIGTDFVTATGGDSAIDVSGAEALSFHLSVDSFDFENLTGVLVKIRNRTIGDSVSFRAGLDLGGWSRQEVCIDLEQFHQPWWYNDTSRKSLPLQDILGIDWEVKINADLKTKATPSTFAIGEVKLWGNGMATGLARSRTGIGPSLVASYSGALRLSYALKDASSAKVEVLRMDGRTVASFEAPASVQAQAFPVALGQGTYLATVRSGSTRLTAPFVVAR